MKEKIKNGYFFLYGDYWCLKVGSRCYVLPLDYEEPTLLYMFKDLDEKKIKAIVKPNGERVE